MYSIPNGGAFEWVSCPHYAAEVAIYAGLVLLTWPFAANVPLMLAWVVSGDSGGAYCRLGRKTFSRLSEQGKRSRLHTSAFLSPATAQE